MSFPIRVSDVMSQPVRTVDSETSVAEAAATCEREAIGSVVVVDETSPVGIVTTADFVSALGTVTGSGSHPVTELTSSHP